MRSKSMQVKEYYHKVCDEHGYIKGSKFMDEMARWDSTVPRTQLMNMFYDLRVLEMLKEGVI